MRSLKRSIAPNEENVGIFFNSRLFYTYHTSFAKDRNNFIVPARIQEYN